jgi:hypothetical protein
MGGSYGFLMRSRWVGDGRWAVTSRWKLIGWPQEGRKRSQMRCKRCRISAPFNCTDMRSLSVGGDTCTLVHVSEEENESTTPSLDPTTDWQQKMLSHFAIREVNSFPINLLVSKLNYKIVEIYSF